MVIEQSPSFGGTEAEVRAALDEVIHPSFGMSLIALGMVRAVRTNDEVIEGVRMSQIDFVAMLDPQALFAEYHQRLYRYTLSLLHDLSEAHDAAQETYVRAARHLESLRDRQALTVWLYRIATHICLDRLRQRARDKTIGVADAANDFEQVETDVPSLQPNDQQTKSESETQTAWAKSFQDMMAQMMAQCSCRPKQMSAMWARCCGAPPEKQEKDHAP